MASRVMSLTHRGTTVMVREGFDGRCVLEMEVHTQSSDKKFPAACREAMTYLLKHGGDMKGSYQR